MPGARAEVESVGFRSVFRGLGLVNCVGGLFLELLALFNDLILDVLCPFDGLVCTILHAFDGLVCTIGDNLFGLADSLADAFRLVVDASPALSIFFPVL